MLKKAVTNKLHAGRKVREGGTSVSCTQHLAPTYGCS